MHASAWVLVATCAIAVATAHAQDGHNVMAAQGVCPVPASSAAGAASIEVAEKASHFLAGVLQSLPAMLPFTAASVNSYQR